MTDSYGAVSVDVGTIYLGGKMGLFLGSSSSLYSKISSSSYYYFVFLILCLIAF
ncbi:hypothetical protein AtEden1_Chr5g0143621 [Arabidopsis thaliana]